MSQFQYNFAGMVLDVDVTFNRAGKYSGVQEHEIDTIDIMHKDVPLCASEILVHEGNKILTLHDSICEYAIENMGEII